MYNGFMTIKHLSQYFSQLESTTKRLEMTQILSELLKESDSSEISSVCFLSLGAIGPQYEDLKFNVAEKMMIKVLAKAFDKSREDVLSMYKEIGDLGDAARKLHKEGGGGKVPVNEVFERLKEIAKISGKGSQEEKVEKLSSLLKSLDPLSARYVTRVVLGTMRLGFSDITLIEGLSWMLRGDKSVKSDIECKYRVHPNVGNIAKVIKEYGLSGIEKIDVEAGVPLLLAKAQRVSRPEEILQKQRRSISENKYDGTRIQVHINKSRSLVKTYTRNLEETTNMFPDLIKQIPNSVKAYSVILDGEAVGYNPGTGKFVPFQITMQRKRKYNVKETAQKIPLRIIFFDILYKDGESLISKPFLVRRGILKDTVRENDDIKIAPDTSVQDVTDVRRSFKAALDKELEGIVVKDLESPYQIGARGFAWIKMKRELDTVDCVVMGYYAGTGQRAKFGMGGFLAGVYDDRKDKFVTVTKVGSGFTEDQLSELKRRCDKIKVGEIPSQYDVPKELVCDVWVYPKIVVSIKSNEITESPIHTAKFALRFPRLEDFRDDKAPQDATTLGELKKMYEVQF